MSIQAQETSQPLPRISDEHDFFHYCGIGISSIFDTVFRYLPIFLTVLQYSVPLNAPLLSLPIFLAVLSWVTLGLYAWC